MEYYIYWMLYVESTLNFCGNGDLILVNNHNDMYFNSVCKYYVKDFCIYINQSYQYVVFFFILCVFICFAFLGIRLVCDFIEWVWSSLSVTIYFFRQGHKGFQTVFCLPRNKSQKSTPGTTYNYKATLHINKESIQWRKKSKSVGKSLPSTHLIED